MLSVSAFRGLAGEVVRSTLRLETWLSIICVFICLFLAGLLSIPLGMASPFLPLILFAFISAWLTGRFAIPASRGDFECGFSSSQIDNGEAIAFALRLIIGVLSWAVPTLLIAWLAFKLGLDWPGLAGFGAVSALSSGFSGIILTAVAIIFLVAPLLSVIIATATSSVSEVLSLQPWRWLYHNRWNDLTPFYAAGFGGMFLFFALYLIPWMLIVALAIKIAPPFGAMVAVFTPALPGLIAPILMGRLAGAFVAGDDSLNDARKTGLVSGVPDSLKSEPDGSELSSSAIQTASTVTEVDSTPRILPLKTDPDSRVVEYIRGVLKETAEVESSILFLMAKGKEPACLTAGVTFVQEVKLGARQKVMKELGRKLSEIPGTDVKVKLVLLDEKNIGQASENGLRIFSRRT